MNPMFQQWIDGDISNEAFMNECLDKLVEMDSYLDDLNRQREIEADNLATVLVVIQQKVSDTAFNQIKERLAKSGYTFSNRAPSERRSIAVTQVLKLQKEIERVSPKLWEKIAGLIKVSQVNGGASIGRVKEKSDGSNTN